MAFYGVVPPNGGNGGGGGGGGGACATVAEYICHGSLRGGLAKIRKKGISDKRLRAHIALQAAHGMEYLHANRVVHFDLKVGVGGGRYSGGGSGVGFRCCFGPP